MYCKSCLKFAKFSQNLVLIVAKCIVNSVRTSIDNLKTSVLIVAKCIVNDFVVIANAILQSY